MAIENNYNYKKTLINDLLFEDFDLSIAAKYSELLTTNNLIKYKQLLVKFKYDELSLINDIYSLIVQNTDEGFEDSLPCLVLSIIRLQSIYYDLK